MDEYISKRAAIDMICSKCTVDTPDSCSTIQRGDDWCEEMYYLLKTPSADVVPVVHGKWADKEVIHKRCIEEWQSARCSVCGKYHTTPYMYYFDDFKFCPNCGAKMDGEKKE